MVVSLFWLPNYTKYKNSEMGGALGFNGHHLDEIYNNQPTVGVLSGLCVQEEVCRGLSV
jgi:hypothetical protein